MAHAGINRKTKATEDFYETPEIATRILLKAHPIKTNRPILEPCVGHGAIARVLEKQGHSVVGTDLRTTRLVYGHKGIDASVYDFNQLGSFDYVITNTPYILGHQFVNTLLQYARKELIIFHRLQFLETSERARWLKKQSHLKKIYVMGDRVNLEEYGNENKKGAFAVAYAWYVFDKSYVGLPTLDWLFYKNPKVKLIPRKI